MTTYEKVKSHPNYYEVEENIWVIKKLIPSDLCDYLVKFAESFPEETWWERNQREWWHGKFLYVEDEEIHKNYFREIENKIKDILDEGWFLSNIGSIHRMQKGQGMFEHADNPSEEMLELGQNYVQLSFVIYISDFEGGEIYYPRLHLQYKPEKGDLLIQPGTSKYTHGVKPVTSDSVRYVVTSFSYDPKVKALREKGAVFEKEDGSPNDIYKYTEDAVFAKGERTKDNPVELKGTGNYPHKELD